jgi:hypothetical protein
VGRARGGNGGVPAVARSAAAIGILTGDASIPTDVAPTGIGVGSLQSIGLMLKSLVRTFKGPSRDPRMAYISRPMPRDLLDEDVVAALDLAFEENPNPAYLVETLPGALRQVTGRNLQVLDRSVRDVTGAFTKTFIMIRDGDVGRWPGYDAMSYPLLAPSDRVEQTRRAIVAADVPAGEGDADQPAGPKPGWGPPPSPNRR